MRTRDRFQSKEEGAQLGTRAESAEGDAQISDVMLLAFG